jgi:RHS repeat-associated protein
MATMSARYTVIDGEVVAQERGGVRHQLVPDPLGSTVALYDGNGTKTDTFGYWPYGESSGRTGSTTAKFQYVGSAGYYQDNSTKKYVRARYLDSVKGRWITGDPIGFDGGDINLYRYVENNPAGFIDQSGMAKVISVWVKDPPKLNFGGFTHVYIQLGKPCTINGRKVWSGGSYFEIGHLGPQFPDPMAPLHPGEPRPTIPNPITRPQDFEIRIDDEINDSKFEDALCDCMKRTQWIPYALGTCIGWAHDTWDCARFAVGKPPKWRHPGPVESGFGRGF